MLKKNVKLKSSAQTLRKKPHKSEAELTKSSNAMEKKENIQVHSTTEYIVNGTLKGQKDRNPSRDASPDRSCSPATVPYTQIVDHVGWNWSPGARKSNKSDKQSTICGTPKRTTQLQYQKRKNSFSPLMYMPKKTPLVNNEVMEHVDMLTSHWKLLVSTPSAENNIKDYCDEQETSAKQNSSILDKLCLTPTVKTSLSNSFDDLFDDCVDEDLIRSSQKIEEMYLTNNQPILVQSINNKEKESCLINTQINTNKTLIKKPDTTKCHVRQQSPPTDTSHIKKKKLSFNSNAVKHILEDNLFLSIPDDSFDKCLLTCVEKEEMNVVFDNISMNDSLQSKCSVKTYKGSSKKLHLNTLMSDSQDCSIKKQVPKNEQINLNMQMDLCSSAVKNINHNNVHIINTDDSQKPYKFFTSKNLSNSFERNADEQAKDKRILKSRTHSEPKGSCTSKCVNTFGLSESRNVPSVSSEPCLQRTHTLEEVNRTSSTGLINRNLAEGKPGGVTRNTVNQNQQAYYTPAEIEKKRLEAEKKKQELIKRRHKFSNYRKPMLTVTKR